MFHFYTYILAIIAGLVASSIGAPAASELTATPDPETKRAAEQNVRYFPSQIDPTNSYKIVFCHGVNWAPPCDIIPIEVGSCQLTWNYR
jgi:hypothetical protein